MENKSQKQINKIGEKSRLDRYSKTKYCAALCTLFII